MLRSPRVETTGLDAFRDRVIEIGIVLFPYDSRALVEERAWDSLVNPGIHIPLRLPPFMGITDLDISAAPFFEELLPNSPHFWMAGSWWRTMPLSMRIHRRGIFLRAGRQAPLSEIADSLILLRLAVSQSALIQPRQGGLRIGRGNGYLPPGSR